MQADRRAPDDRHLQAAEDGAAEGGVRRDQDPGPRLLHGAQGGREDHHPLSQDQTYRLLDRDSYLALVANLQTAKL